MYGFGLCCFFLLTFFFYHFSCNLSTSLLAFFFLFFGCALSTFLSIWKKLSVPTSVNVFSLVRTKAAEPGVVPVCVCAQGMCQDVFMGTAAELVSSGWAREARLFYRLHIFTDFYLQFAGKSSLKSVLTVR